MAAGSGGPWRLFTTFEGNTNGLIKGSTGAVLSAYAENRHTAKQYLQLFNKTAPPSPGDTPFISVPLPAGGGGFVLESSLWGDDGQKFNDGISYGISSTVATFTAGNPNISLHLWYF